MRSVQISVMGDSLTATESAKVFDANGQPTQAPVTPKLVDHLYGRVTDNASS
jgi:hypothetical protein